MPAPNQAIAVTFAAGVDTRTDAKQVAVTKLTDLQNCVFTKNSTLVKRNGYASLGTTVDGSVLPYSDATGMGARDDEAVLFANGQSYSYRDSTDTWNLIGPVSSIVASANTLARTGTQQTLPDVAINGGVVASAWIDNSGGVWCAVTEQTSGRFLLAPMRLDAGGAEPRCVAVGNVLHVLWSNGSNIWTAIINPAMAASAPVTQVLISDYTFGYDVVATYDAFSAAIRPAVIAWGSGAGTQLRIAYVHPSGVLGGAVTGLPGVGSYVRPNNGTIAVAFDVARQTSICCVYWDGAQVNDLFVSPSNLSSDLNENGLYASTSCKRATVEFDNGGLAWIVLHDGSTGTPNVAYLCDSIFGGFAPPLLTARLLRGHDLTTRAFNDNGHVFVGLVYPVLYFPYVAICQVSSTVNPAVSAPFPASMSCQSRLLPGLSAGARTTNTLSSVVPVVGTSGATSRQHMLALGYRIQLDGPTGSQFGEQGIQLFTLDFDHGESYRSVQLGSGLYLAGSLIQHYDGRRWAEADFHCAPDTATGVITATQTTGGTLTALNSYSYKIMYEEIDAAGELHPGPTCVPVVVVLTGSNDAVTLTIPTYRLTSKLRVRIGVFRTTGNATGTDATIEYFRVSSVLPQATGANGYVLNDPTVDSVTFVDQMPDSLAADLEPLYTNGGILSNAPPPSKGDVLAVGKLRLFWTDPLDADLVHFSQQLRDDTAAEMVDGLTQSIPSSGGAIVSIAVMDDNVVVFRELATYAFAGPGPEADGGLTTNSAFSPTQLVTSDVGCKSAASVVSSPNGIAYQTAKGIRLLGRDLQINNIGDDVFAYNDQHITRATLIADQPQLRFLTDSGRTLMWDYTRTQWSTFTNHEGYDAVNIGGVYHYLRTDGRVFAETVGVYSDGGAHIPMLIETAWIKATGYLQGWQRIRRALVIGEWESLHTLRMRYRLNYEPAYSAPLDANVDAVYAPNDYGNGTYGGGTYGGVVGLSSTVYQTNFHINKRCQAVSFRFEDIEPTGSYGAAFELSELLLIGGVVGPAFKPGAARQS